MSLLKKASIITTPTAYAEDYLYSIKPAQYLGSEIIADPNFDTDSTGAWSIATTSVTPRATKSYISDGKFMRLTYDLANGGALYKSNVFTVGFRYKVSFIAKGTANSKFASIGDNATIGNAILNPTLTTDWQRYEFEIKPNFTLMRLYLAYASVGSTLDIDEISVKKLNNADFDFDRNSTGTRVNEDYLIEDVPYNLVDKSEEQEDWSIFAYGGASIVRTPNQQSPFYDNKAVLFDFTAGTGSNGILVTRNATVGANMNNTLSVWMKGVVGGEIVKVACRNTSSTGNDLGTITITNQWKRYTFTIANNLSTTDRGFQFRFTSTDSVPTQSLFVYGAQIVKGDQPKDYLKTTDRLDIPRIDYTNGEPSILLEPSRTNKLPYSQDFTDSGWLKSGSTISTGFLSPEGINNASKLTATNTDPYLLYSVSGITDLIYAASIYIKGTSTSIGKTARLWIIRDNVVFHSEDFTITNIWQRISTTKTFTTTPSSFVSFRVDLPNTDVAVGNETLIYGAQLEVGSYATSLIHTSGSAVTRSADAVTNAGNSDLFNDSEGVLYVDFSALSTTGRDEMRFLISNGTNNERVQIGLQTNDTFYASVITSNVASAVFTTTLSDVTIKNKLAISYKENLCKFFINGRQIGTTDISATMPTGLKRLDLYRQPSNNNYIYGNVKMVAVFKEALSDTELECLTGYNNHELYMNYYNRLSYLGLVEEYNVESDINNYIL